MITIGQTAEFKRGGRKVKGVVNFVSNDGTIGSFKSEGCYMAEFFHQNKYNGKFYTATGIKVSLT